MTNMIDSPLAATDPAHSASVLASAGTGKTYLAVAAAVSAIFAIRPFLR